MNVWTWEGKYFGYIEADDLWTYNGLNVGRVYSDKIFGPNGNYLGEIKNGDRLITHIDSLLHKGPRFTPSSKIEGRAKCISSSSIEMLSGYRDFPPAESF